MIRVRQFIGRMETPYDRITYPGGVYAQAQISRFATVAALHGLKTPDLNSCRVLELGCNRGLHLIGMALRYPGAQFVGVDLSETAIARATELVEALELKNINFRAMDVTQLGGRHGECDYLIAHGLYSWVPAPVREKIMELAGRILADNGIAYISYNTYPGWYLRRLAGDMIRLHTEGVEDPIEKHREGVALIATLVRTLGDDNPYTPALKAEGDRLLAKNPQVAFFDELAAENTPVYFGDFVRQAQAQGLQFVGEVDLGRLDYDGLAAEAREILEGLADPVLREQYTDFFKLTAFRQSVLCRQELAIDRDKMAEHVTRMYLGLALRPVDAICIDDESQAKFVGHNDVAVTVMQPFIKAALAELAAAWPARILFTDLETRANARLATPEPNAREMLVRMITKMQGPGLLDLDVEPYPFATTLSEKPVASPLVRLQAANGTEVVSLRHALVDIDDEVARLLTRMLDGTRDRTQLTESLRLAGHTASPEDVERTLQRMLALSMLVA